MDPGMLTQCVTTTSFLCRARGATRAREGPTLPAGEGVVKGVKRLHGDWTDQVASRGVRVWNFDSSAALAIGFRTFPFATCVLLCHVTVGADARARRIRVGRRWGRGRPGRDGPRASSD